MAGPNEQKFKQAIAQGNGDQLRSRATKWTAQADALGDVADEIDQASRGLEPVYSASADAVAAQNSLTAFSKTVRTQQERMLKVAAGLNQAAEAMDQAHQASLGPELPDAKTDPTPREQDDYEHAYMVKSAARESAAKAAYDKLVSGYAKAGVEMSQAAPEVPAPAGDRSGGRDDVAGPGASSGSTPTARGFAGLVGGGQTAQAHVQGYTTNPNGTTVDLSPTGNGGTPGHLVSGTESAPGVSVGEAGATGPGSGVNAAQATGGTVAGGAALAGGLALGKGARSLRGAVAGRSAASPAKPVRLGQTSRSGAGGVLGKAAPAAARGAGTTGGTARGGAGAARAGGATPSGARSTAGAKPTSGQSAGTRAPGARASGAGAGRAGSAGAAKGGAAGSGTNRSGATGSGATRSGAAQAAGTKPGSSGSGATKGTGAGTTPRSGAQGAAGRAGTGRGARNGARENVTDVDHIVFEDEQAWLEDGETNPGVIR